MVGPSGFFDAREQQAVVPSLVEDATEQYKRDRDPREKLFEFGRCVAHSAVDDHAVQFCTHLNGKGSWFLPFNQGWNDGAGNPPNPNGLKTDYLWKRILTRDGLTNILENYTQVVETKDEKTGKKRRKQICGRATTNSTWCAGSWLTRASTAQGSGISSRPVPKLGPFEIGHKSSSLARRPCVVRRSHPPWRAPSQPAPDGSGGSVVSIIIILDALLESRSARDGCWTLHQLTPLPLSRADAGSQNVLHEDDQSVLVAGSLPISCSSSLWKGQPDRCRALGALDRRSVETASGTRFDIHSRLGGHLHGDDPPAQDDCKAHGPWPGRKHRH